MKRKSDFWTRTITAFFFALVLIASIMLSRYSFVALFFLILVLGMLEFFKLVALDSRAPNVLLSIITGASVYLSAFVYVSAWAGKIIFAVPVVLAVLLFVAELYRNKPGAVENLAISFMSVLYVALPLSLLNFLVLPTPQLYKPEILMGFVFLIWVNDSGAYVFGISFGKNKLFERISPKKSWEGTIGGALSAFGFSMLLPYFFPQTGVLQWLGVALIVAVFGNYGDLVQSLLKRSYNRKDSGTLLPGHGGILDRFDSLLLASPLVFFYSHFFYF